MKAHRARRGFTLIELLVVIAVIGILAGLLLAGVMSAREASRRAQCQSNLKQIALAAHGYHDATGSYPSCLYLHPALSKGPAWNNASWISLMLPHIEQPALANAINSSVLWGSTRVTGPWSPGWDPLYYGEQNATVRTTTLALLACPSDPSPRVDSLNADEIEGAEAAGTSYVGSIGSNCLERGVNGYPCADPQLGDGGGNGIFWRGGSRVSAREVTDGLSNTFLAGEQLMAVSQWNAWVHANQSLATTAIPLNHRHPSGTTFWAWTYSFRSRHPGGANFAFCDGSVRFAKSTIDFAAYQAFSTRAGGEVHPDDGF